MINLRRFALIKRPFGMRQNLVTTYLDLDVTLSHSRRATNRKRRRYRDVAEVGPLNENTVMRKV